MFTSDREFFGSKFYVDLKFIENKFSDEDKGKFVTYDVKNVPKAQIIITCFNRETNKYNFHSLIDYGFCKLQMSSDSFYKLDEIKEWIKLSQ